MFITSLAVGSSVLINGHRLLKITDATTKHVKLAFDLPAGCEVHYDQNSLEFRLTFAAPRG